MKKQSIYDLRDQFIAGQLSRRNFLKQSTAIGISAAAASSLLSATSSFAATPKSGGTLRVAISTGGETESLDPTKYNSSGDYARGNAMYSPLTALDRKMQLLPALAESWESNSTADEWVFNLRKGVTFHNGKDFTSADVVYSLNRHLREGSESPAKPILQQVTDIQADGKYRVKMKVASPNADLPVIFTQPQLLITQDGEEEFKNPAGTGAYKLKEYQLGIVFVGEKFDGYWGSTYLDSLELHTATDMTARMNAMMAGEYDIAIGVDRKLLDLMSRAPGIEIVASPSGQHTNLAMMCDRGETVNNDVRMALKYCIPREKIVKNVFKGYAMVGNDHQVAPTDPFYCHDIPQRTYDPDKAKYHLKKAGMENGSIILHTSDQAVVNSEAIALLYKEAARAANLNVEVKVAPPGSYWSKVWMQVPFCVSGWNPRPTADLMLTIANKSDGSWNETKWGNARFDQILTQARGELDKTKRAELYCEMQRMLHDDGGVGMLAFYDLIDSKRDNVMGFDPHPAGYNRNAFFSSEVWLS